MARAFLDGYETYDPEVGGYGDPDQWRQAFFKRMGFEEAKKTLNNKDPLVILGITTANPTWEEISTAFRKKIIAMHPDKNKNKEAHMQSKIIIAAFEVLEDRYGIR